MVCGTDKISMHFNQMKGSSHRPRVTDSTARAADLRTALANTHRYVDARVDEFTIEAQRHERAARRIRAAIDVIKAAQKVLPHQVDADSSDDDQTVEKQARENVSRRRRPEVVRNPGPGHQLVVCRRCGNRRPLDKYGRYKFRLKDGTWKTSTRKVCSACCHRRKDQSQ